MTGTTSTPLAIAMTSYYLPGESKIGAGYQAHGLAQALTRRGHRVTMFSPCAKPEDACYGHHHIPIRGRLRTLRWPFLLRRIDLSGFDVLHAHGDDHLFAGRRRPVHVRTMHGSCLSEALHIDGAKERLRMVLLGLTEVAATAVADRTVCVSHNTRTWFPWVRAVIPCGVDTTRFRPTGALETRPTILFVGTYLRRKRGRLLMEAFARDVLPRLPDARLWMVCDDAPNAPGVEVLGRLSDEDLADRYARAWVFSLPSSYEGFGVPYIEAMASGTPVVATPNAGANEVLAGGRYGVLVRERELGTALASLLGDDARRGELSAAGVLRSAEFGWDVVCEQYEQLYAEIGIPRHAERR